MGGKDEVICAVKKGLRSTGWEILRFKEGTSLVKIWKPEK